MRDIIKKRDKENEKKKVNMKKTIEKIKVY